MDEVDTPSRTPPLKAREIITTECDLRPTNEKGMHFTDQGPKLAARAGRLVTVFPFISHHPPCSKFMIDPISLGLPKASKNQATVIGLLFGENDPWSASGHAVRLDKMACIPILFKAQGWWGRWSLGKSQVRIDRSKHRYDVQGHKYYSSEPWKDEE